MKPFIINPHGRLQEWVAEEKGYFEQAGLENFELQSHALLTRSTPKIEVVDAVTDNHNGAYQTYKEGRDSSVSCACHWTVNMAAAAGHGRLWGECYSVSPCAIMVSPNSEYRKPEDLAGVAVQVGYLSGSHYTTVQALEPFLSAADINLAFGGNPSERVDQLLEGVVEAATVFGPQLYILEQLGYRKIIDCTFMIAAMVDPEVDPDQTRHYFDALRLAQRDLDQMHQPYLHHYLKEIPEHHAKLVDVKRFGPGERIVFEPYSESMYQETQQWILDRGIVEGHNDDGQAAALDTYNNSVIRLRA
ncbi:MAG: hypothetical protein KTR35_02995 [Gammaproteobacteria bacterium]|nr:hypothetical protein [Gammaproteobacteria bacterium]